MLAYLQDISSSWRMAKWTHRVCEWVVRRAGLMLKDETGPREDIRRRHQEEQQRQPQPQPEHTERMPGDSDRGPFLPSDTFQFDPAAFDIDEALPEQWIQDFLGESFFGQLDDELLMMDYI